MNFDDTVYRIETRAKRVWRKVADVLSLISPKKGSAKLGTPRRIGVLVQWRIGDTILALPLMQGLQKAYPKASIEVIGQSFLADLLADESWFKCIHILEPPWTKYQNKYLFWQKDWRRFLRQLWIIRKIHFDLLISVRFDPRDSLLLRLLNTRETAGYASAGGRYWVTQNLGLTYEAYHNRHSSEVSSHALEVLTGLRQSSIPRLQVNEEMRTKGFERLKQAGYKGGLILAIHAGAGHPIRRWSTDNFNIVLRTLPDSIGFVVVIDHMNESNGLRIPKSIPSLVWQSNLADLKSILSVCDVLLCCDGGVMHMGAACGCRIVAVFGPQLKKWFGPCGEGHEVVKVEPMPCRPCNDNCIHPSPICMERVPVQEVSETLNRLCVLDKSGSHFKSLKM